MEKWKIQLMLLKTKTKQNNKTTYNFWLNAFTHSPKFFFGGQPSIQLLFFPFSLLRIAFQILYSAQKLLQKQYHGFAVMILGTLRSWKFSSRLNYWITEQIYWVYVESRGWRQLWMWPSKKQNYVPHSYIEIVSQTNCISDFMPAFW